VTESSNKDQNALNNPLAEMSFGQQITKSIEKQDQNNAFFGLEQLDINSTGAKIKLDHRFSPVNVNNISLAGGDT
jgi:hypothetical protein